MAETVRGKLVEAGNAVSEAAQKAGHRISESAAATKDWATRKLEKAQHRVQETSQEAENRAEEARIDESAKEGGCGCS